MAQKPNRYERFDPNLSTQSKKNIGEGRVLANIIKRGELPYDTTLKEARDLGFDLTARPRKGKRKKGLLPEMTKKEYKAELNKKIKEFSKDEKRIYNALAQREKRGYVPKPIEDISGELEDFLASSGEEDEPEAEVPVQEVVQEVVIPQGISTSAVLEDVGESSEEDFDDVEFESAITGETEVVKVGRKKTFKNNPIFYTQEQAKDSDNNRGNNISIGIALGEIKQDPADKERIKQKIRDRNKARAIAKAEERNRLIQEEEILKAEIEEERRLAFIEQTHTMPDGSKMTGKTHSKSSVPVESDDEFLEELEEEFLEDLSLKQEFIDEPENLTMLANSPSFQPPSPTYGYEPSPKREFTRSLFREVGTPQRRVGIPSRDGNRVVPNTQKRVGAVRATPPVRTTKEILVDAGVGNLSYGGESKSYRLKDFDPNVRGFNQASPTTSQPVFQQLLKNNRDRRSKK